MKPAAARVDDETLDALQVARGRVPIEEFRLREECADCTALSEQPVTTTNLHSIYDHIAEDHADEIM